MHSWLITVITALGQVRSGQVRVSQAERSSKAAVLENEQDIKVGYVVLVNRERERNVLFNDTLNTFYLRLHGIRYMVKDHSDSEKGNPLPPHRLLLSINSKGSFICTIPQTG